MNNSMENQSSNPVVINVESTEGGESPTSSSALPHRNGLSHQDSGNMDNSPEIQLSHSDGQGESAGGVGDSAVPSEQAPQQYCREVSVEDRERYLELYEAAKNGKWKAAKTILDSDIYLVRADLTNGKETILHVATQANQFNFVRRLLTYLDQYWEKHQIRDWLESKDVNENNAFLFAVASGNLEIVDMMGKWNEGLRTTTGHLPHFTPLHVAALHGKSKMAHHLYEKTKDQFEYGNDGLKLLLFLCASAEIYDLALKLLRKEQELAFARNHANETILHILSRQPLGLKQTQQHELVEYLWKGIFPTRPDKQILENIRGPTHVAFNAVEFGNLKLLKMLLSTYPHLIWDVDEEGRSIIHIAVLKRAADIFNFTNDIGSIKDIIVQYKDNGGSNLLHMAATLSPKDQPNLLVSGPAFQMTLELLWFEAVKKIVPPSFIEMKNADDFTPQEVFTNDHKNLVDEAQSWTKKTTNCCMVVSTLITTGVFAATFSIPGGVDDETGSPHYLEKKWFMIFSIFDAIAMMSSSTSIFIFFSILISRHAELDFQYKSLPIKLIFGLITLLISIISMMISFSSAFIMYYNTKIQSHGSHHNGLKWVPIFICVLAFIPISIFGYLLFPLCCDIAKLTKFSCNLSQTRKNMLFSKKCCG